MHFPYSTIVSREIIHGMKKNKIFRVPLLMLCFLWPVCFLSYGQSDTEGRSFQERNNKPWPVSKYTVRLGAFMAINTTNLGAGVNGRNFSGFNFEEDLDMDRHTYSGMFGFTARFGKHHRADFSYYNIYRKTKTTIDKDIHFGEHVYPMNSDISAFLNTNIFRLSYGYSFVSNSKWDVGALFGLHVMAFDVGFDWNGGKIDEIYEDDVHFTAPLPDLGFFGTYAINDRWAISGESSWLYVKYKDLKGGILNASLYGQYKLNNHWEIALGYSAYDVRANLDRTRLEADFEWGYHGPFINVAYKFGK